MLNKPVEEILYDKEGKVTGVKSGGEIAKCKKLLADPTYFIGTDKIKQTGQVVRCIAITSAPIAATNTESAQIILPASEFKRKSDIYVSMVSYHHKIAANGKYVTVCSTKVETKEPNKELAPALALLGKIDQQFFWVSDTYAPTGDGSKDNVFISSSYDPTTHFESATREALVTYQAVSGHKVDLSISAEPDDLEDKSFETPTETPAPTTEKKANKTEGGATLEDDANSVSAALDAVKLDEEAEKAALAAEKSATAGSS